MKKEHNVERFFCVVVGCGVILRTAADLRHHYKESHNHDTGKRQAPEESGELKRLEGHHNKAHQGTQRVATGGQDQPPPRAAHTGTRGTKRPESGRKTSSNVKQQETNKGGGGDDGTENKRGVKRKDPRVKNTLDQHRVQENFQKKFHKALNDLKAKEKAFSGNEEPTEGTQEDAQHPTKNPASHKNGSNTG